MIEGRPNTIQWGVETIGGGLSGEELTKLKKRSKQEKKKCKGCITKIVPYNRDHRGHVETLCYSCRSKVGYPTRDYARDENDGRRRYICANGHDIAEVGRRKNGSCRECDREKERARHRAQAEASGNTYTRADSRLALTRLAALMEEHGVSLNALERRTGIPAATLRGYARVGQPKGYKCPPERAKMIAGYFRLDSVAELTGETP